MPVQSSVNKTREGLKFEKVPRMANSGIIVEVSCSNVDSCTFHYHTEVELTFIVSGTGRMLLNSKWIPFTPGDLAWIPSEVPHLFVPLPDAKERAQNIVLKFENNFAENVLLKLPDFSPIGKLLEIDSAVVFHDDGILRKNMETLMESSGYKRLLTFFSLLFHLSEILPSKTIDSAREILLLPCRGRKEIEQAINYISSHFQEKLSLAKVASEIRMDQESFRRLFKRTVLAGFSDYLLELRLSYAEKLLLNTSQSISEIALQSGFHNLSNFNRLFLKRRMMTPRQYRHQ